MKKEMWEHRAVGTWHTPLLTTALIPFTQVTI